MTTRASTIPAVVPDEKLGEGTLRLLYAIKENVDFLYARVKFAQDFSQLPSVPAPSLRGVSATGAQVRITNGPYVADAGDHATLVAEVKALANDVAALRRTVDAIVDTLKRT